MIELKPCPFCGHKGRLSFRNVDFGGWNGYGEKKIKYIVQVICTRCHARGGTVKTDWLKGADPRYTEWGYRGYVAFGFSDPQRQHDIFLPYVEQAAAAWNRREE